VGRFFFCHRSPLVQVVTVSVRVIVHRRALAVFHPKGADVAKLDRRLGAGAPLGEFAQNSVGEFFEGLQDYIPIGRRSVQKIPMLIATLSEPIVNWITCCGPMSGRWNRLRAPVMFIPELGAAATPVE